MERATPVLVSMFEAFKTKVKIELTRKPSYDDLEAMLGKILASEQIARIGARLNQLEGKIKELEMTGDESEENYDDFRLELLDDIEISVEKQRRRSRPLISLDSKDEGMLEMSPVSIAESEGSTRLQLTGFKTRSSLESPTLSTKLQSKRQMLMLSKDLTLAHEKLNKLYIDYELHSNQISELLIQNEKMSQSYISMQDTIESIKREALLMTQHNEKLQKFIEESGDKSNKMKDDVNELIEAFKTESGKHINRLVNIETDLGEVKNKTQAFKSKMQKNFNESVELNHKSKEQSERLLREVNKLKESFSKSESEVFKEIQNLKGDLMFLKGPVHEYLQAKGKESEILTEEVRRHQDLFRKMTEEYISILDFKMGSPNDSTMRSTRQAEEVMRLKQENAHLRATSASPSVLKQRASPITVRRCTNSNFDWDKLRKQSYSLKPKPRPYSRITSLNSSARETPQRLRISIKR